VTGGHPPVGVGGCCVGSTGARPVGVGCYLMLVNELLRERWPLLHGEAFSETRPSSSPSIGV
jgi:hypothetical protein